MLLIAKYTTRTDLRFMDVLKPSIFVLIMSSLQGRFRLCSSYFGDVIPEIVDPLI